ncbi:ribosomal protein L4/L1 family-domain-containing protein [Syncephalastrum racemosum]|uniref:Large ribosomal subunit protein uL4m n=1 Tax=Syncephalastrum racemosum TaxID=13706 RepID=A0A1X2GZ50_SYNRA|nr:ribosomal protein L4/L1 family-domain-containing protein [Syncephalastrum racemosum]
MHTRIMSFSKTLTHTAKFAVQRRTLATATERAANPFPQHVQAFLRDFKTSEPLSIIDLDRKVFNEALRRDILHRVVVWQRDGMRQGTASTKTRSEVAGTSKKQAPQKGRGKARIGDGKAPQFVGGGIAFGPKPRDHSTELPRKVQEMGLRVALSTKYAQDQLKIVKSFEVESHKARALLPILEQTYQLADRTTLMITHDANEKLELAARNIPRVEVIHVDETNVLDLLTYDQVVLDKSSADTLSSVLRPL